MPRNSGKEGFIAIIALAIFALIMLFGILVQTTVVNTFASVKNTDNYFKAKDLADSLTESMQFTLKSHLPGYSTGRVHCRYEPGAAPGNGGLTVDVAGDEVCAKVEAVGRTMGGHTIDVVYEIKGRPGDSEKISSARCPLVFGQNLGCFSTPMKDGDAGSRCSLYPLEALFNGLETVDSQIAGTAAFLVDHLDYPCNWNKLTFGSSLSDRVAVPLFYDDGHGVAVNPYKLPPGDEHRATKFVLRLRTPCLPCGASLAGGGTRACGADPTVCRDDERYQLSVADGDEMVVQWQLDGRCTPNGALNEQECGLVGYPDEVVRGGQQVGAEAHASGLYEGTILSAVSNVVIDLSRKGQVSHLNGQLKRQMSQILSTFTLPIFTLFLNHSLTSDTGSNIPYLEYQVLTDNPIGNSKTMLEAVVTVDGSSYTKTLFKEQSKPLIDFAIQN